jgi:hypothetical protein
MMKWTWREKVEDRNAVGLRDEIAPRVADAASKIEDLVDDRAHRDPRQHDRHFVDGRKQLAGDHFAGYGVGLTIRCGNRMRGYGGHFFFLVDNDNRPFAALGSL